MNFEKNNTAITALSNLRNALPDAGTILAFLQTHTKVIRIILAALLVLTVAVSCFGGGGYKDAVEQYILAITTQNGEILMDMMPKAMVKAMLDEETGYGDRDDLTYYLAKYAAQDFGYGIVTPLSMEVQEIRAASDREMREVKEALEDMREEVGVRLKVTDAKTAQVMVQFESALFGRHATVVYVTLYKIGGDWCFLPL